MPTLVNIAAFNLIWLIIVGGAFNDFEAPGLVILAVWIGVHLRYSRYRRSDIRLLIVAVLVGPLIDTLLIQLGLVRYTGYAPVAGFAPLWVVAMWANFALLPNHSMRIFRGRLALTAGVGALGAPLAYRAGAALGAAEFAEPAWTALAVLAAGWALVLPVLMQLTAGPEDARRLIPA